MLSHVLALLVVAPGEIGDCEHAPKVPMRLVIRHCSRRVRSHHGSPSPQSTAANTCQPIAGQRFPATVLLAFCDVTCVERMVGWWPFGSPVPRYLQPASRCLQRPARRSADPLYGRKSLKTGGRSGHAPPYQLGSTCVACTRTQKTEMMVFGGPAAQRGGQKMDPPCAN